MLLNNCGHRIKRDGMQVMYYYRKWGICRTVFVEMHVITLLGFCGESAFFILFLLFCSCSRAIKGIEDLCNKVMANHWEANGEWLFAIPLLHFLRGDSRPFEEPSIEGDYHKPDWIGAQKLRIKDFQKSGKQ